MLSAACETELSFALSLGIWRYLLASTEVGILCLPNKELMLVSVRNVKAVKMAMTTKDGMHRPVQ